jgi:hypothetical protein
LATSPATSLPNLRAKKKRNNIINENSHGSESNTMYMWWFQKISKINQKSANSLSQRTQCWNSKNQANSKEIDTNFPRIYSQSSQPSCKSISNNKRKQYLERVSASQFDYHKFLEFVITTTRNPGNSCLWFSSRRHPPAISFFSWLFIYPMMLGNSVSIKNKQDWIVNKNLWLKVNFS